MYFMRMQIANYTYGSNLGEVAARLKLRQEDIAKAIGVSQGQISRILAGRTSASSNAYRRTAEYVFMRSRAPSLADVRRNEELIGALAAVWDGSAYQARVLSQIIRSFAPLTHHAEVDGIE